MASGSGQIGLLSVNECGCVKGEIVSCRGHWAQGDRLHFAGVSVRVEVIKQINNMDQRRCSGGRLCGNVYCLSHAHPLTHLVAVHVHAKLLKGVLDARG